MNYLRANYFRANYFRASYIAGGGVVVVVPPAPEEEVRRGGGGSFRGTGERRRIKGRTPLEDIERIIAQLERADETTAAPPPAAETVAEVRAAVAELPDTSGLVESLEHISVLLERLGQERAAAQVAAIAKRKEEEAEEEAVIMLLLAA